LQVDFPSRGECKKVDSFFPSSLNGVAAKFFPFVIVARADAVARLASALDARVGPGGESLKKICYYAAEAAAVISEVSKNLLKGRQFHFEGQLQVDTDARALTGAAEAPLRHVDKGKV